jgi:hypothetical protein
MTSMTFQFFDALTGSAPRKVNSETLWHSEHALYRVIARLLRVAR